VWVLPVMVYVVHRATANGWWWPAAAALFAILGAWPYRFPADEQPRTGLYMFPDKWVPWECLANLYLLLYAAIMIGAAMIAYRRPACVERGEPTSASPAAFPDSDAPTRRAIGSTRPRRSRWPARP